MIRNFMGIFIIVLWIFFIFFSSYRIIKAKRYNKLVNYRLLILSLLEILIFLYWVLAYFFYVSYEFSILSIIIYLILLIDLILNLKSIDEKTLNYYILYLVVFSVVSIFTYWLWIILML